MSDRDIAAARVADIINEAERAMDAAMARASQLLTELPALQGQAGLNGAWAQPAGRSARSSVSSNALGIIVPGTVSAGNGAARAAPRP